MNGAVRERVPDIVDLMHPTLEELKRLGGSGRNSEIDSAVADRLRLDEEITSFRQPEGQSPLFNYRSRWARSFLKYAGAAENTARGVWTITAAGRRLKQNDMPEVLRQARAIAAKRPSRNARRSPATASETGAASLEKARQPDFPELAGSDPAWRDELLEILQTMRPAAFERLTQLILRESNFSKVEVTGKSGDGGIDGSGVLNVALISFQVLFQCKRFSSSVGANAIRDFRGTMVGRADKGIFITTGAFTRSAKAEAIRDGAPPIDLIDGERLCGILKELGLGVETRQIEEVAVDRGFFETI